MTTNKRVSSVVALLTTMTIAAAALAAPAGNCWRGSGGWSTNDSYGRMFDVDTVMLAIDGEIVGLSRFTPMKGMTTGVHIKVKTATETVDVHLGAAWVMLTPRTQI